MVDEKQIEKLDKRVGRLEDTMSTNFSALAGDVKEIKDCILGSEYQTSLKKEHAMMNNWYKIANNNGELKFLSDTHKVSRGLYIIGAVVGISSIYNIVNLFQLILDNLK